MSFKPRIARLTQAMRQRNLNAFLVTHLPDVRWLSGFTGSNATLAVYLAKNGARLRLFTDGRYTAQVKEEVQGIPVTISKKAVTSEACMWLEEAGIAQCGLDSNQVTVASLTAMKAVLVGKTKRSFFLPVPGLIAKLREVKDETEIATIRRAAALGCALYEQMLAWIEAGQTEIEVAAELEYCARLAGAEAMSFETIVASGVRSSLPHGRATSRKLSRGDLVTLDFGVILDGYCSDMTRTVYLSRGKQVSRQEAAQRDVFEAVLAAQQAAVEAVRPGITTGEVDEAARSVLRLFGLEKEFSHSTGHGVGLEIHEGPRIGAKGKETLETGMVITIEPGAYLPGKFGVRIEDMVLVAARGFEVLTPTHKGWTEL